MFILALVGVAVNAVNFFVLGHHGHSHGGHDHGHEHSHETAGHSHSHGNHSHDAHADHGHSHDEHTHCMCPATKATSADFQIAAALKLLSSRRPSSRMRMSAEIDGGLVLSCPDEEKESKNINLHGAVLHVIGDLVQSIGVAIAGALIWWKQVLPGPSCYCL